jgi:hypothetical protein
VDNVMIQPELRRWAEASISRIGKRVAPLASRRPRKLLLVHLDGVPHELLRRAISEGQMPFLARLVNGGHYQLDRAFWGSPASTPCFQAGVLYGLRHPNLPAYSWFDRDLGRSVRMNAPKDALAMEKRLDRAASGSLLEGGGTSYLSLFRAQAANRFSMTALTELKLMAQQLLHDAAGIRAASEGRAWEALKHIVSDTFHAAQDVLRWVRRLGDWRHERQYLLNRLFIISMGWRLAQTRAVMDMVRGVPAIYLVFGNFDEVAHRRGPLSTQATGELYRVDRQLEELHAVSHTLDEPYDLVFVTDHGHVDSVPFEQRNGQTLEGYLLDAGAPPLSADLERALLHGRPALAARPAPAKPVVENCGNFAHVYLTRERTPLEAREILAGHRELLARAVAHPDLGIVALRRGEGAVAVIRGGVYGPEEISSSPLPAAFSKQAVADFLRELPHMATAGDLAIYGQSVSEGGTVGFAWEFGSHGGLTRIETDSVVLWPKDAPYDLGAMGHATQLHQRLSAVYRS